MMQTRVQILTTQPVTKSCCLSTQLRKVSPVSCCATLSSSSPVLHLRVCSVRLAQTAGQKSGLHLSSRNFTSGSNSSVICQASPQPPADSTPESEPNQMLVTAAFGLLWVALVGYVALYSPNQTPFRDSIFLERLVGLGEKDGFVINPVVVALFNIMGVYPAIYAALLVPAGRSDTKVPAWPFLAGSCFLGVFALLPFMAQWRPMKENVLPPPAEELEGWNKLFMKGAEAPYLPLALLLASSLLVGQAATAGGAAWGDYLKLFDESRFIHVTSIDFAMLTALLPFWMGNDAQLRNWGPRETVVPILSCLPVVGPALYLVLRPKTFMSGTPGSAK